MFKIFAKGTLCISVVRIAEHLFLKYVLKNFNYTCSIRKIPYIHMICIVKSIYMVLIITTRKHFVTMSISFLKNSFIFCFRNLFSREMHVFRWNKLLDYYTWIEFVRQKYILKHPNFCFSLQTFPLNINILCDTLVSSKFNVELYEFKKSNFIFHNQGLSVKKYSTGNVHMYLNYIVSNTMAVVDWNSAKWNKETIK